MLFLADFPEKDSLKDGMLQRIVSIDFHYKCTARTYLHISFTRYFKKRTFSLDEYGTAYKCNFFLHFFFIWKQFKRAKTWYFHSIYNVLTGILFLSNSSARVIWDVHGAVPEELEMMKCFKKAAFFTKIEQIIYNRCSVCIVLTKAMQSHLKKKYGYRADLKFVEHQIFPSNILNREFQLSTEANSEVVNIIYSGNTQVWQNIDLLMATIEGNLKENIIYYILTGELDKMTEILKQYGLLYNKRIVLRSVPAEELGYFYSIGHYGFILRDDVTVNNVACPTKIIEYMSYGMIPIVKTENIGDFCELGYEYIKYTDFDKISAPRKSEKNKKIVDCLLEKNFNLSL